MDIKGRVTTFEYTEHSVFPTPLFYLYDISLHEVQLNVTEGGVIVDCCM